VRRDRLDDRSGARIALDRARGVDPQNIDVVRELSELLDPPARAQVLAGAAQDLRLAISRAPAKVTSYDKLAMVAAWQSDADARWLALLGVEAMGTPSPDQRQVLAMGRSALPPVSRTRLTAEHRHRMFGVADKHIAGSLAALDDLWKLIAPAVTAAVGVDAGKLGFARGDRIAIKKLGERYAATAAALGAFAVDDAEIYIGGGHPGIARVLSPSTPVVCLATDVAEATTGHARFLLGRAAQFASAGTGILAELRDAELWWYWAAATKAAELPLSPSLAEAVAGDDAAVAERARAVGKALGRKEKKLLAGADKLRSLDAGEIATWRNHAISVANRAGLLLCGDLAIALAMLDAGRGGRSLLDSAPALDLVAWSVGEGHLVLRRDLGYAVGGNK
jgi:hypothetical protein